MQEYTIDVIKRFVFFWVSPIQPNKSYNHPAHNSNTILTPYQQIMIQHDYAAELLFIPAISLDQYPGYAVTSNRPSEMVQCRICNVCGALVSDCYELNAPNGKWNATHQKHFRNTTLTPIRCVTLRKPIPPPVTTVLPEISRGEAVTYLRLEP